jgi:hypothetical protein
LSAAKRGSAGAREPRISLSLNPGYTLALDPG